MPRWNTRFPGRSRPLIVVFHFHFAALLREKKRKERKMIPGAAPTLCSPRERAATRSRESACTRRSVSSRGIDPRWIAMPGALIVIRKRILLLNGDNSWHRHGRLVHCLAVIYHGISLTYSII